jgi:hypothetical protein
VTRSTHTLPTTSLVNKNHQFKFEAQHPKEFPKGVQCQDTNQFVVTDLSNNVARNGVAFKPKKELAIFIIRVSMAIAETIE